MKKKPPRRNEHMLADFERWQLEMAEELGLIEQVRHDYHPLGRRPVLRPQHQRPNSKAKSPNR